LGRLPRQPLFSDISEKCASPDGQTQAIGAFSPNDPVAKDFPMAVKANLHGLSYDKEGNLYVQNGNANGRLNKLALVKY